MNSAYTAPLLITGQSARSLERLPLSRQGTDADYSERWLQDLLFTFPQALPIADIDESFSGLVPICREMNTPAGPIDAFYLNPRGKPVILEAKLWRNPEARRKVIGQILDYAKELSRFDYEDLDAAVRAARRVSEKEVPPRGAFEVVAAANAGLDEAVFIDSVARNLRRGDVLLLVAGDGIHEGAGAIAEFLESHGTLQFTFGMVETAIFSLPDGSTLVQPRVIAQSEIIRRVVVDLRSEGIVAQEVEAEELESSTEVTDEILQNRERFRKFWTDFLDQLRLDDRSLPVKAPAQSQNQYFHMPKGTNAWISAVLVPSSQKAGVFLTFGKGPIGDRLYGALLADRDEIAKSLGVPVEWKSKDQKHMIQTLRTFSGKVPEEHQDDLHPFLADTLNRYINVFKPRLERLIET